MRINKLNLIFIFLIFLLSFIYFYNVVFATDKILIHGDYRYGLTVQQHLRYHLNGIFVHAPKLPFLTILYILSPLGDILAEKMFTIFILFLSALFVYSSNKYFLEKVFERMDWKLYFSAFVGCLVFLYNPWTINKIHHHYWLVLSLASSYLLLAEIDKLIHGKFSYLRIISISFLITSIATQVQGLILYFGFLIAVYVLFFTIFEGKNFVTKVLSKKVFIVLSISLLLNVFWIIPQVLTILSGLSKPSWYGIVAENIDTLSRRCTVLNVITATNRWIWNCVGWLSTPYFNLNLFGIDLWKPISLLPFVIATLSILFLKLIPNKKRKYLLYFSILLITSVVFSTGSYYPIVGDFYRKIFLDTSLGWVIRDPYKNTGLVILSLSFLISLTSQMILINKIDTKIKLLTVTLLILPITIWGWPALTGNLNGHLTPYLVKYPKDLEKTIDYLEAHLDYQYNAMWYPTIIDRVYFAYEDVPQISSSDLNIYILQNEGFAKYIENLIKKKDSKDLNLIFKKLAIKYIILRHDLIKSLEEKRLLSDIKNFEEIFNKNKITKFGNFTIYKIQNANQILEVNPVITYSTSPSFDEDFKFDATLPYIYFKELYTISRDKHKLPEIFSKYILKVRCIHYAPEKYWSVGSIYGGWLKRFEPYLKKFGIENWQLDYGYGLVFTWAKNTNLTIPFKVEKTDNYKLFIRYFKNQKGGEIIVYLDGKPITIETKDQLNEFVWKDLGTFHLKAGEHKIVLENVNGFNAVNLFVLIPEKDYIKAKEEVEKLLQSKTIIYIFEAESDLYRSNAKVIKDPKASNGEMLLFYENGKAWQDVEVVKNGTYRLALRGYGDFKVTIANHTFHIHSNGNYSYTPLFLLKRGEYRLEITSLTDNAKLDVIWLYSTKENKTIQELFEIKEKPARVISFKKVNPTLWKVQVQAKKPFMLSFAEAYDPLWEARVYKNGKLVEKVKPIPLYSVINGFWINETGNLTIIIRYLPQDWFELGLKISATTFIVCIAFLFYDWRREKGDKWAKRLEDKVKSMLNKILRKSI